MTTVRISINGIAHEVPAGSIAYAAICDHAGLAPALTPSVTYWLRRDRDTARSGTLAPGGSVEIASGMAFNCYRTGAA